ncbi:LysR substrate-binding domain-containing protein [Gemmobacter serpentinus]|uniref:LysR substrate-binding domain-containing protein n=1 Tax=Gemmobacter serpentinus TaxID=2652247 RepID=UPI00124BFC9D|nr:LysR substrate-binding domain-containing protein [Gemmobacter serpentinus]
MMDKRSVMHPGVKLRHIRAFLDIAAEGGLSIVARAQGITQPALSRTLAELEDLLGQPLFLRQGRRLVLTEGGRIFRRHAALAVESLEAGAAALRPGSGGSLQVGVLPTAATRVFPAVVLRFRELRPEILLSVETGPHHHLIRQLREGGIDLMIGRLPDVSEMPGLSFEHLYEEDVVLVGRAGHPLGARPVAEALANVPLILPPRTALIRRPVDDYLASLGLIGVVPAVETVSLAVGRGICLASDALWFISRGVIAEELEHGLMQELPVGARFLSGAVGITRRQSASAPGLATLEEVAREIAAQMPPPSP